MDSRRRWALLSLAMAGTLAAIFYPDDGEGGWNADSAASAPAPAALSPGPARAAAVAKADTDNGTGTGTNAATDAGPGWIAAEADPFAVKGWQPPPPVAATAALMPAPVAAVDATAPPPPPPLPFKFVGQMNDGADQVIYLSNGDQVVLARQGDVLEGGYKVSAISPTQIEFESVSSGLKQPLAIPAKDY